MASKSMWIFVAAAIMVLLATNARAKIADGYTFAVYISGGFSLIGAPDTIKNEHSPGLEAGFGLGYRIWPRIELLAKLDFFNFALDNQVTSVPVSGGEFRPLFVGIDVKYFLNTRDNDLEIFALAGLGSVNVSFTDRRVGGSYVAAPDPRWEFFANAGFGLQYPFSNRLAGFVSGRYIWFEYESRAGSLIPFALGVRMTF